MIDQRAIDHSENMKRLNVAELIEWGYQTSGDFDEALRVYIEQTQREGLELFWLPNDRLKALRDFALEFGENDGREFPEPLQE